MAGFEVLNNMAYGVMTNEKLVVLSTNSPFIPIYDVWNGVMHECNYNQRSMQPDIQHDKEFTARREIEPNSFEN
jgi:hypothetical protein